MATLDSTSIQSKSIFVELRNLWNDCKQFPSTDSISSYKQFFLRDDIPTQFYQPIETYLLAPFPDIIINITNIVTKNEKPKSSEQLLLVTLETIEVIFTKLVRVKKKPTFVKFFNILYLLISSDGSVKSNDDDQIVSHLTEDLSFAILKCFKTLFCAYEHSLFNEFISRTDFKSKSEFGHLISILTNYLNQSKQPYLVKKLSVDLLLVIHLKFVFLNPDDISLLYSEEYFIEDHSAKKTAFLLPRTASTIFGLISLCSGQDYYLLPNSLLTSLIDLLNVSIYITFKPYRIYSSNVNNLEPSMLEVDFTEHWFDETTNNLEKIFVRVIDVLIEHPDQEVRSKLQKLSSSLLMVDCQKFVVKFAKILLRVQLAYYVNDPSCLDFMNRFGNRVSNQLFEEFGHINNLLHEELFVLIKKIPLMIRNKRLDQVLSIEQEKHLLNNDSLVSLFRILIGYFHVLQNQGISNFFKIDQHKFEFIRTFVNVSELDFDLNEDVFIMDRYESIEHDSFNWYNHRFKNLNTKSLQDIYQSTIHKLCGYLSFNTFQVFFDHFLELLHQSDFDPNFLLVFNIFLFNIECNQSLKPYIIELIHLYRKNIDLAKLEQVANETIHSGQNNKKLIIDYKKLRTRHCLLLQGITYCHISIHRFDTSEDCMNDFFRTSFCHFLEAYSHQDRVISFAAKNLLYYIGKVYGYNGESNNCIVAMTFENLDYIYAEFAIILEHSVLYQNIVDKGNYLIDRFSLKTVATSLETIFCLFSLKQQNYEIDLKINYFNQLLDQILNIIQYYSMRPLPTYSENLNILLKVLLAYLQLIEVIFDKKDSNQLINNKTDKCDNMISMLEDYIKNCQINLKFEATDFVDNKFGFDSESNVKDDLINEDKGEENIKLSIIESPIIKSRTGAILYQCSQILSDTDIDVRLNTLLIASKSMKLLRSYEDILLPYVHKLWDPLVARFSSESDHPIILKRAYDCLLVASEFCGDFLLSPTREKIIPKLTLFLQSQLDNRISYFQVHNRLINVKSVEYFAEKQLLSTFGLLANNLNLQSHDLWTLIPVLLSYIILKPIDYELQRCALDSLIRISKRDSGSIRLYIHRFLKLYYPDFTLNSLEIFNEKLAMNIDSDEELVSKLRHIETQPNFIDNSSHYEFETSVCNHKNGYESDKIDSDLEDLLYTSIHHQTVNSCELSFVSEKSESFTDQPNCKLYNKRTINKRSIKKKKKQRKLDNIRKIEKKQEPELNLSYGNLSIDFDKIDPTESLNKFYNEDLYDSEEEALTLKKMSNDKRFWKIDSEDSLSGFRRRSQLNRLKRPCKKCGGFGHLVKNCPWNIRFCILCCSTNHYNCQCNKRQCSICYEHGHQAHKCGNKYKIKSKHLCKICKLPGHFENDCTLVWRKFLNVTDEETYKQELNSDFISSDIITINSNIYCPNCGGKHFAFQCRVETIDKDQGLIPPPVSNWKSLLSNSKQIDCNNSVKHLKGISKQPNNKKNSKLTKAFENNKNKKWKVSLPKRKNRKKEVKPKINNKTKYKFKKVVKSA